MHAEISIWKEHKVQTQAVIEKTKQNNPSLILQIGYKSSEMLSNSKLSIKITFPATKQSDISKSSPRCSKAKPRSSERGKGHQSYPGPEEPRPPSFRCYFQNRFISSVATRQKRISPGVFSANVQLRGFWAEGACKSARTLTRTRDSALAALWLWSQHAQPSRCKHSSAAFQLSVPATCQR